MDKEKDKDDKEIKIPIVFKDKPHIVDLYIRFRKGEFDG